MAAGDAKVALAEGRRRLAAYAVPLTLEDGAGPVVGPSELAACLGIARSTLQDRRRAGAAIGLLRGTRKNVFPLAQFVDGRPAPGLAEQVSPSRPRRAGLAEIVKIIGEPRTAWLWLVEPRRYGNSPIGDLKLDPAVLADLSVSFSPGAHLRACPLGHRSTPPGAGHGRTRFSSPDDRFKVLYIAEDLSTALAETLFRDRFENRLRRRTGLSEIAA